VKSVGLFEAKTHLSALVDAVAGGETIELTKNGKPVARLVPIERPQTRDFGSGDAAVVIASDFDRLPPEILAAFYGK
jgi:prevent-host-death family protein